MKLENMKELEKLTFELAGQVYKQYINAMDSLSEKIGEMSVLDASVRQAGIIVLCELCTNSIQLARREFSDEDRKAFVSKFYSAISGAVENILLEERVVQTIVRVSNLNEESDAKIQGP